VSERPEPALGGRETSGATRGLSGPPTTSVARPNKMAQLARATRVGPTFGDKANMRASGLGWIFVVLVGLAGGCSNACDDLSSRICQCEQNSTAVATCNSRVNADNFGTNPSKEQLSACSAALDTCTCAALACGEFYKCGMAVDPGPNFDPGTTCSP
jgi:hypothetical protein